jgi:hypothetical protein
MTFTENSEKSNLVGHARYFAKYALDQPFNDEPSSAAKTLFWNNLLVSPHEPRFCGQAVEFVAHISNGINILAKEQKINPLLPLSKPN